MNSKNKTLNCCFFDEQKFFQELKNRQIQERNESELQKVLNKADSDPNLKRAINREDEKRKRLYEIELKKKERRKIFKSYSKKESPIFEFSNNQISLILEKIDEKIL